MFYRLYILFADMVIDEIIKEMLITAFSKFIYIEENKSTLVFQVYNQEHDGHQNADLERVLSTIFQDTSIKINCFVSQLFSDNQLVEESLAATHTFLEACKNVVLSKYHVITHSQALAKMYLCYQELALFDEYTNFGELKNNHIELLQLLFKLNNNVVATSNHMYMHRNTINYQLQKIIQITGCDIRNSDDVFLLQLYFFVHDVHRKEI